MLTFHGAPIALEVSGRDLRHLPSGFHTALTVNTDSQSLCMNVHTAGKAVDLVVV